MYPAANYQLPQTQVGAFQTMAPPAPGLRGNPRKCCEDFFTVKKLVATTGFISVIGFVVAAVFGGIHHTEVAKIIALGATAGIGFSAIVVYAKWLWDITRNYNPLCSGNILYIMVLGFALTAALGMTFLAVGYPTNPSTPAWMTGVCGSMAALFSIVLYSIRNHY